MSRIVVALGGNALGTTPNEQLNKIKIAAPFLTDLVKNGHEIVITHGNGPQVGQIALAMEYSAINSKETPDIPFAECGSMSQGYIGYGLQQILGQELAKENINKECITIITQTLVDINDSAFTNPTKPIGNFYTKEDALKIEKEKGYSFVEDAGRGYRRVVPSPKPIDIIEKNSIAKNLSNNTIVIAAGGGGIPVIKENNALKGIAAVIDKDLTSSLLAKEIDADTLLILTAIEKVYINFNKENQIALNELTVDDALKHIKNEEFAKGSMLPKVEACIEFVKNNPKRKAIITSLDKACDALNGLTGTMIKEK